MKNFPGSKLHLIWHRMKRRLWQLSKSSSNLGELTLSLTDGRFKIFFQTSILFASLARRSDKVRRNLLHNRRSLEARYNPHRKPYPFKVDDFVWLSARHVSCAWARISTKLLLVGGVRLRLTPFFQLLLGWFILSPEVMCRVIISHT
jgi:hypothetical protein